MELDAVDDCEDDGVGLDVIEDEGVTGDGEEVEVEAAVAEDDGTRVESIPRPPPTP